ncbi:hypothetical protein CCACVL1_17630 [Corchorus capsularis]|uniref:F-box domain-containing protein n=1 Tax=Corchorus capsularis TaxID=210143 RepID=A0A1R3HRD7_COCAP|nr:hypothetical protein CCACVL1_17630 [Corchorus capsularis]
MVRISVSATNLRTFWYQGKLPDQFQLKNTSNLVEVLLDLWNCKEFDCEDVLSLLASIKYIEILRLSGWLLEWLCSAGVIFRMLDFEFEKLKELKWMDSVMNKNKRDSMACFLNICPALEKLVIEIDPKRGSLACPYFHHYWHEPHLWMDNSAMKSNTSKLENLKVVELMGFRNEEDEFLLIDLLLNKANLVKSVSVTPEHHSWQVAKIPDDEQGEMEDEGHDFISNLPQDILKRILSLLPLEEAVRTTAFSNAWRTLWLPDLVTCHGFEAEEQLKQIIALLCKSYGTHKIWKLCSSYQMGNNNEVIALATKGVNQELHLDFSKKEKESMNLVLKLNPTCPVSHATSFPNLKMLHFRSINNFGKHLVSALFSNSMFLENLELQNCSGLQSLDIEANDSLESLKLLNCPDLVNISVSARNLRSFWYQGVLPNYVQLQNSSDLVEVMFDLRLGFARSDFDFEDVISFLISIKEIEILTISSWLIEIDPGVNSVEFPISNLYWHEPHLWLDDETVKSNTFQLENLKIVEFWGYRSEEDELILIKLLLDKANMLESVTVTSPDNHSWEVAKIPQPRQKQILKTNNTSISNLLQKQNAVFSLFRTSFLRFCGEINVVLCPDQKGNPYHKKKMEEERRDFLSNLPLDILKKILSLLPLEEAVRTTAFSNSWRTLWLPDLVAFHGLEAEEELKQIITLLSKSYDCHQIWKLLLCSSHQDEEVIALATKGVDQELRIEFPRKEKLEFLNFHLKLKPTSPVSFSTLKILRIRSVTSLGKNLISALFSSSKFLEILELENCSGLLSLEIEAYENLQSLKLLNCPDLVNITVSGKNLRKFWYQGVLPNNIQLQNCLELVEVMFDLRKGFRVGEFDCEDVINFLNSIKEIEILTISSWLLEIDPGLDSVECPFFHQYWHDFHLWMDDETVKSNTCQLENLKIVEFWGYKSEEDEFLLIKLLLDKANMVQSVTVTSPDNHSWEIARIPQHPPQLITKTNKKISNLRQKKNDVFDLFKGFFLELLKEINYVDFCPQKAGFDMNFWF